MGGMDDQSTGMTEKRPLKLAVFGSDAAEAAQVKRIDSLLACGFVIQGFMMRRFNMNSTFQPFWDNLHLGTSVNESQGKRLLAVARSILKVVKYRRLLRDTDLIVARNLDMLMVATVAKAITPNKSPKLIYECLDINNLMTGQGLKSKIFRWIERRLLSCTSKLVVSAPDFITCYFEPYQSWYGRSVLVENKIWMRDPKDLPRPSLQDVAQRPEISETDPIVLGWIGTLRCQQSLDLLVETAKTLGPRVRIEMHGVVHHHALTDFDTAIAAHDNLDFHGPYDYPKGLRNIYQNCDAVWSQDMWQWGTNSTWLLPNRIYEASYFGCPSIAVAGTGTGVRTASGLGWTISSATSVALISFLNGLKAEELTAKRIEILRRPDSEFLQSVDEIIEAFGNTSPCSYRSTAA